ncbi:MAG: MMPL family transporter [Solirubrobacterales bacterium]
MASANASRRSLAILGTWTLAVAGLALLGTGLTARLAPTSLLVPGSPSARAHAALEREFGNSVPVTILLEGPPAAIDGALSRLGAGLRAEGDVRVMAPPASGRRGRGSLRPQPGKALLIADFQRPESAAMSEVVPAVRRVVEAEVKPPLRAHVGGVAAISTALQEDALHATHEAELLVAPILVLVLLLVFRSPVAAALPLLIGAATVLAGRGLLLLCTYAIPVNALAVAIASMMGLALGVDYALLMVSRFRQERDASASVDAAIATAAKAAGRTIAFAGGTLALVMLTAALIAPGDLLGSVAAGVVVSTLLSVGLAISLLPALLRCLSSQLERWRLPGLARSGRLLGLARAAAARPWIAIPLIALPMLAIAAPAVGLAIGPPDPRQLPPSDPTRQGFEALREAIGPGWAAPIVVLASAARGTISEPDRLEAISRWQEEVARDPDVAAVIGPASLQRASDPVDRARRAYASAPGRLRQARRGLASLRAGLREAGDGVAILRRGLGDGAAGAAALARHGREAQRGAQRLAGALGDAASGAARLSAGLDKGERSAARLVRGQRRLAQGAARVARGLRGIELTLRASMGQVRAASAQLRAWSGWLRALQAPTALAGEQLDRALRALAATPEAERGPRYSALVAAVEQAAALVGAPGAPAAARPPGLPADAPRSVAAALVEAEEQLAASLDSARSLPGQIERLATAITRLRRGSDRVAAGSRASAGGTRRLRSGLRRLRHGGERLEAGIAATRSGGERLDSGLTAIAAGADRLAGGLRAGRRRSGALASGLAEPDRPLRRYATELHGYQRDLGALRTRAPGAIDSGYLLLTALDGTVPGVREQISQVVNLDRGGQAARLLIVPRAGPNAASTRRLGRRLRARLPALARASDTTVEIGEGAQSLVDYTDATLRRLPWLVLALSLVSTAALVAVLRSLPLPILAIALNLLTIAAAFGALEILFALDLLTGPPYVDAISAAGVLTIMFALSIDYEVFLLARMREAWLQSRDYRFAIDQGIARTAGVITGAAAIMSSVFLVFATAEIASLQQFGAGLTFAVALDATVVRLVLLPALMRTLGPRAWSLPGWLDRLVPAIDHGDGEPAEQSREPTPEPDSAVALLGAATHDEHRRLLELLSEVEAAGELRRPERVVVLVRELRRIAEPHFGYEQEALFPQLTGAVGRERIERLRAAQERMVADLTRIEELAGPASVDESAAAETRRLLRSARSSVAACDALTEDQVAHQGEEVAERVLAARRRAFSPSR